jgi:hypothetical protein
MTSRQRARDTGQPTEGSGQELGQHPFRQSDHVALVQHTLDTRLRLATIATAALGQRQPPAWARREARYQRHYARRVARLARYIVRRGLKAAEAAARRSEFSTTLRMVPMHKEFQVMCSYLWAQLRFRIPEDITRLDLDAALAAQAMLRAQGLDVTPDNNSTDMRLAWHPKETWSTSSP